MILAHEAFRRRGRQNLLLDPGFTNLGPLLSLVNLLQDDGPGIAASFLALLLAPESVLVASTAAPEEPGAFSLGAVVRPHWSHGSTTTNVC